MIHFFGMTYSPWTAKARWALSHHQLPYKYHEHLILFGMPHLRWKLRRFRGDVTLPAIVDGKTRLIDSFEIARYADSIGKGSKLFPEKNFAEIKRMDQMSEDMLCAARALVLDKLMRDPKAQQEMLPEFFPRPLRPLFRFLCRIGTLYVAREFKITLGQKCDYGNSIRDSLLFLRAMLKAAGTDYVLGEFSYADISMAAIVQAVAPYESKFMREHPAVKAIWQIPEFRTEFQDLVEWRDRVRAKHFGPK